LRRYLPIEAPRELGEVDDDARCPSCDLSFAGEVSQVLEALSSSEEPMMLAHQAGCPSAAFTQALQIARLEQSRLRTAQRERASKRPPGSGRGGRRTSARGWG